MARPIPGPSKSSACSARARHESAASGRKSLLHSRGRGFAASRDGREIGRDAGGNDAGGWPPRAHAGDILQRVGRYEEAAEANRRGAAADLAYSRKPRRPIIIRCTSFTTSSSSPLSGDGGPARGNGSGAQGGARAIPDQLLLAMPGFDWGASFIYDGLVKFGMWDEMLKEPPPVRSWWGQPSAIYNRAPPRSPRPASSTTPGPNWSRRTS